MTNERTDPSPIQSRSAPVERVLFEPISNKSAEKKDTNPKDAVGTGKVPGISVLPQRVLGEVGLGMLEGARKYGRHNYRVAGVRASVYVDAVWRHLAAWWEGEDIDPDSGLSHVTKAIASLFVLRDGMMQGNWEDDRPPACAPWTSEQNAKAAAIVAKHPDAKEPWTQKRVEGEQAPHSTMPYEPCSACGQTFYWAGKHDRPLVCQACRGCVHAWEEDLDSNFTYQACSKCGAVRKATGPIRSESEMRHG